MPTKVRPMLAAKEGPENWLYPCLVSPKLDGIRCLITSSGPQSRSGKSFSNRALTEALSVLPKGLDGELITGDPRDPQSMSKTQSVVNSHEADFSDTKLWVFDYFWEGAQTSAEERQERLRELAVESTNPLWARLESTYATSAGSAACYSSQFIEAGYEGACSRPADALYKFGRCARAEHGLSAYKPFADCEVVILWLEEKQTNGNEQELSELGFAKRSSRAEGKTSAGTLGRFRVRAINGPFKGVEFYIGRGSLTDAECKALWEAPAETVVGRVATIKYQLHGSKDKPRSPRFWRWF